MHLWSWKLYLCTLSCPNFMMIGFYLHVKRKMPLPGEITHAMGFFINGEGGAHPVEHITKRPQQRILPARVNTISGEGGIRTHGALRLTRSPGVRVRPDYATSPNQYQAVFDPLASSIILQITGDRGVVLCKHTQRHPNFARNPFSQAVA